MDVAALRDIGHATTGRTVAIDIETYGAILDKLERYQAHLIEKNDIIRAYAGPGGMSPEDVWAALEQVARWQRGYSRLENASRLVVSDRDIDLIRGGPELRAALEAEPNDDDTMTLREWLARNEEHGDG